MKDPKPANIQGRKVHKFEHRIRWDYALIAVAVVYGLYKFSQWYESPGTEPESAVDVEIMGRENDQVPAV